MPVINQNLLSQYLTQRLDIIPVEMKLPIPDEQGLTDPYMQCVCIDEEDAKETFEKIQKLFLNVQTEIENEEKLYPVKKNMTRTQRTIHIPMARIAIKFLNDLKTLVKSILGSYDKKYFAPQDYNDPDHFLLEQAENTFIIPTIHKEIYDAINEQFQDAGIILGFCNLNLSHLFKHDKNFVLKVIKLSQSSIKIPAFIAALNELEKPQAEATPDEKQEEADTETESRELRTAMR
jgi:hypothetical protein